MKAIIPVGGRGTRMRPVTFTANKHFIPVGNKPLIHYPIETIVGAGIHEIGITYNPGQLEFVKDFLGDGSRWGATFEYIVQPQPVGLANIVEVCEQWLGDDKFVLHLGDNIFDDGIIDLVQYFQQSSAQGLLTMLHHPENTRMGVPYFDDQGQLIKYVEKPQDPPHDFAVPGLYFGDKTFFEAFKGPDKIMPSARGEFEIPDPFQWLINHGYSVEVREYTGKWLDPGKFNDWLDTNQYLLDKHTVGQLDSQPEDTRIEGRATIGKNSILRNCVIRGPVNIGDDCHLENSFIGPYSSIYHHCRIINAHIENSVLMESVSIEYVDQPIDTSIIGPNSQILRDDSNPNLNLFLGEMSKIVL